MPILGGEKIGAEVEDTCFMSCSWSKPGSCPELPGRVV